MAFFDYDRDGWLDLVVVNYVDYDPTWPCQGPYGKPDYCAPKTFKGRVSRLFHNQSAKVAAGSGAGAKVPPVQFQDVTVASGLGQVPGPGLGVMCADFDGDGWPDIFIANDGAPNRLWINQHNGTFKEVSVPRGVAYNAMARVEAGMGIPSGDVDGAGLCDLSVTHLTAESHTLGSRGTGPVSGSNRPGGPPEFSLARDGFRNRAARLRPRRSSRSGCRQWTGFGKASWRRG